MTAAATIPYSSAAPTLRAVAPASRRLKVLLLATHVDPDSVGEASWGFQLAHRVSQRTDATVLTLVRPKRRGVPTRTMPHARVLECADWPFNDWCERFDSMLKPGYLRYYRFVRRFLRDRLAAEKFDLVHQFTPHALRYPTPAFGLDVPVILGPYGGSVPTPAGFEQTMASMPWYTKLRGFDAWRLRRDPLLRRGLTSADLVLGVAPYVSGILQDVSLRRFDTLLQTGISELPEIADARPTQQSGELRLLYVGRVTATKGVLYAVRALAQLRDRPGVTLDVVGDGEALEACREESERLGLADRVRFHGRRSKADVNAFYATADVVIFPSLREAMAKVLLEAMSFGLPLIVSTTGGPGAVVDDRFGVRVTPKSSDQYTTDIARAVRALADDPARVRAMADAARREVADKYLWDRKIDRLIDVYHDVVGRHALTDSTNERDA